MIRENEIFISVIRDLLIFQFVNRAKDPPCTTLFAAVFLALRDIPKTAAKETRVRAQTLNVIEICCRQLHTETGKAIKLYYAMRLCACYNYPLVLQKSTHHLKFSILFLSCSELLNILTLSICVIYWEFDF